MNYRNLDVWKISVSLALSTFKTLKILPKHELYGIADQMRRAAVSIPSNIAEGAARESDKEFKRFLYIAMGSAAELETQFIICQAVGYLDSEVVEDRIQQISTVKVMLSKLIEKMIG